MNAVAEEVHKHRSTDGVTPVKILLGVVVFLITTFMGTIAYVYTANVSNNEKNFDRVALGMDKIAEEISKVNGQAIAAYGLAKNNGAWLSRMEKENRDFRKETRRYWGRD